MDCAPNKSHAPVQPEARRDHTNVGDAAVRDPKSHPNEPVVTLANFTLDDQRKAMAAQTDTACAAGLPKISVNFADDQQNSPQRAGAVRQPKADAAASGERFAPGGPAARQLLPRPDANLSQTAWPPLTDIKPGGSLPIPKDGTWPRLDQVPSSGALDPPPYVPPSPLSRLTDADRRTIDNAGNQSVTAALVQDNGARMLSGAADKDKPQMREALAKAAETAMSSYKDIQPYRHAVEQWLYSLPPAVKDKVKHYEGVRDDLDHKAQGLNPEDSKNLHALIDGKGAGVSQAWKNQHPELMQEVKNLNDAKRVLPDEVVKSMAYDNKLLEIQNRNILDGFKYADTTLSVDNNRAGARDFMRTMARTLSPSDQKAFGSHFGQTLTDALGMTKGQPFKEMDPNAVSKQIQTESEAAMKGEPGAVQKLRDTLKGLPPEVLAKAADALQKQLGDGGLISNGVKITRDPKGDVTEMQFDPASAGRLALEHSVKVTITSVNNHNASFAFAHQVEQEYEKMPTQLREMLVKNGVKINVTDKLDTEFPELKGTHKDLAVGLAGKDITIAEREADRPESYVTPRPEEILRHEVGHEFDRSMGNISGSEDYQKAFNAEWKALPPDIKSRLEATMMPEPNLELFAEQFAKALGGSDYDKIFDEHFPQTQKIVQDRLNRFYSEGKP